MTSDEDNGHGELGIPLDEHKEKSDFLRQTMVAVGKARRIIIVAEIDGLLDIGSHGFEEDSALGQLGLLSAAQYHIMQGCDKVED